MPAGKSHEARDTAHRGISSSKQEIRPRERGSRHDANIKRVQIPSHRGRQVLTLACRDSSRGYDGRVRRRRVHIWVDPTLRSAFHHNNRPRLTVFVGYLPTTDENVGNQMPDDNSISSRGKWIGGAIPPQVEGVAYRTRQRGSSRLVLEASYVSPLHQDHSQT